MSSNHFFQRKRAVKINPAHVASQKLTEDELGECIRDACKQLGWRFGWVRKLIHSSNTILDLMLIKEINGSFINHLKNAGHSLTEHWQVLLVEKVVTSVQNPAQLILHRELKGFDRRGRLGKLTPEQEETIKCINAVGGNAALWVPDDWFSGKIERELLLKD